MMTQSLRDTQLSPLQMITNLAEFEIRISALCDVLGVDLSAYVADHIAMRINQFELAEKAHHAWLEYGKIISSAEINGRPIIVLDFSKPLVFGRWTVECLELPYPAQGKTYPEQGWEHVEFVVPSSAQSAEAYLQDVLGQFPELAQRWSQLGELGVKVKLSSPKGEGERLANPTVAFKYQGVSIKLHPHSLKTIVASEQS